MAFFYAINYNHHGFTNSVELFGEKENVKSSDYKMAQSISKERMNVIDKHHLSTENKTDNRTHVNQMILTNDCIKIIVITSKLNFSGTVMCCYL